MIGPDLAAVLSNEPFVGTGDQPAVLAVLAGLLLSAIHLFGGRLLMVDATPRDRLLSAAGGVSVTYVFLHLLPEVPIAGQTIAGGIPVTLFIESHAYVLALAGFVAFYGLEWYVRDVDDSTEEETTPPGTFWIHIGSFAAYNTLIGYLIVHREDQGAVSLLLFVVAIGLHMLVNDVGLRHHHCERYRDYGRWVLSAAVIGGVAVGLVTRVTDVLVAALFAFIGGGIILNVIKEELPEHRKSKFPAFAAGTIVYTVLLLII